MAEIDQLKKRIDDSKFEGVPTAHVRDDYEPIGGTMIRDLTASEQYVTIRTKGGWRIYNAETVPYDLEI